ncbi:MAG: hypothetical protein DWH98_07440 [Planctomycetota bacterium]|nr:MAG: hypothetical protein DWH98_07440 [Planctomycetota bacterium]
MQGDFPGHHRHGLSRAALAIGSRIGRAGRDGLGGFTKGWKKIITDTNTFAIFQFCLVPFVSSFVTNARRSLPLLGPP